MALVQVVNITPSATKRSDTARLRSAFPLTPEISGYTDAVVTVAMGQLHNGVVAGNVDFPNQSLDYIDAPTGADPNKVGGPGGQPWTDFSPNIASPTALGQNPNDIPAPPPGSPQGSRMGSTKVPASSSPQIADQQKGPASPGNLIKGSSGATP